MLCGKFPPTKETRTTSLLRLLPPGETAVGAPVDVEAVEFAVEFVAGAVPLKVGPADGTVLEGVNILLIFQKQTCTKNVFHYLNNQFWGVGLGDFICKSI